MARTRLSSKGQVVLPKEVRDLQGWPAGTELEVESQGNVVVLRPARLHPRTTLDEVIGCVPYDGPPVPVEEMDAGVDAAAREMWDAFERQGRGA
jgi:AbrB family looped-hinge helix DNA binding protein